MFTERGAADATPPVLFTTTTDFDGDVGSKQQFQGSYLVETRTDNLGIGPGNLELGSLKGDSFTLNDADADTFKWDKPASCTQGTPATRTRDIANNVLEIGMTNVVGSGDRTGVVMSGATSSDIDARFKIHRITSGASTTVWYGLLNEAVCDFQASATVDGALYEWFEGAVSDATFELRAFTILNGAATICGSVTTSTTDPIFLRMSRSTDTWTWFYSSDGSSWTQDETGCVQLAGSVRPAVQLLGGMAGTTGRFDFDEYNIQGGTVNAGGFQTSGIWTSATQPYTGPAPAAITIQFSNASVSNYITSIGIADSSGSYLFQDPTDLTSGTSRYITIPFMASLQQDWQVRVDFTGGGSGTPTLEEILVDMTPSGGPGGVGSTNLLIACRYTIAVLRCQDTTNYSGYRNMTSVDWYVDGAFRASSKPGDGITIPMPLSIERQNGDILLMMVLRFANGGSPSRSWVLTIDNTPLWGMLAILAVVVLYAIWGSIIGGRRRNTWFESVRNPSYKDTAIKVSEDPPGWTSYRQRPPDYPRYTSRRVGNTWIVYGLRPASAKERARTGRRFVAEVQTVRVKNT